MKTTYDINSAKSIFESKTFYGAILALTAVLFPTLYAHILTSVGIMDPNLIAAKIVGGIGGVLAIYGRFVATQAVTLMGSPKTPEAPVALTKSTVSGSGGSSSSDSTVTKNFTQKRTTEASTTLL
jgi:hypothetical protein